MFSEAGFDQCCNMRFEHTSNAGGSELVSWDWDYGSMDVFLDFYPNWIHLPNVIPNVPFRKGIQLRLRSWYATLWISHPVYSLALRLRNTKVPVWSHESMGYPKMDISHWDAAIHYGVQLGQYYDQTRSLNTISRRSPPVYSLALRLRNTKVPVWSHESMGYPKMDINHWDAAIHYDVQLAHIVIKPDLVTLLYGDFPLCTPLPYNSGAPKYLCGLMSLWGTRKWTSAIGTRQFSMPFSLPNIVIRPDLVTLLYGYHPLSTPLP